MYAGIDGKAGFLALVGEAAAKLKLDPPGVCGIGLAPLKLRL